MKRQLPGSMLYVQMEQRLPDSTDGVAAAWRYELYVQIKQRLPCSTELTMDEAAIPWGCQATAPPKSKCGCWAQGERARCALGMPRARAGPAMLVTAAGAAHWAFLLGVTL